MKMSTTTEKILQAPGTPHLQVVLNLSRVQPVIQDVIVHHLLKLGRIFEKVIHEKRRKLSKRSVGRRKDGKWVARFRIALH